METIYIVFDCSNNQVVSIFSNQESADHYINGNPELYVEAWSVEN
jgi:hypothetical protein